MLIGFAPSASKEDIGLLRDRGCERILSPEDGALVFDHLLSYLRRGDVVMVSDLACVGNDVLAIVTSLSQLDAVGVALHVLESEIVPGTKVGDSFTHVCAILAQFASRERDRHSNRRFGAQRGRPPALRPEQKIQIERLLTSHKVRIADLARILDVSQATVYRNFPRRPDSKLLPRR